jgi:hypothetical protein
VRDVSIQAELSSVRAESCRTSTDGRSAIRPLWLLPNLLSLDAPVIAVVWQALFAEAAGVRLALSASMALALAVWSVYLADRMLDAGRAEQDGDAARHRFCREHRNIYLYLLILVFTTGAGAAAFVRPSLLVEGISFGGAVMVYFAVVHRPELQRTPSIPKEFLVSLLFAAGTILAPWMRTGEHRLLAAGAAGFFLACLVNTSVIEDFEWKRLRRGIGPGPHRLTRMVSAHCKILSLSAAVVCAGVGVISSDGLRTLMMAAAASHLALFAVCSSKRQLTPEAFRVLADVALLSPAALLLWRWF